MREAFAAAGNSETADIKSKRVTTKIFNVAMKVCR